MSKSIDTIVQETIDELNNAFRLNDLNNLSDNELDKARQKAQVKMKEILANAFDQAEESQRRTLFKQLSLKLHTDKLLYKYPNLSKYFQRLNIEKEFSDILNTYKENIDVMGQLGSNPLTTLMTVFNYLQQISYEMLFAYQRYPEPISTLVDAASWIINVALIAAAIALGVPAGLLLGIAYGVEKLAPLIIQGLSEGQYQKEFDLMTADEMKEAKEAFVMNCVESLIEQTNQMPDGPEKAQNLDALKAITTFEQVMVMLASAQGPLTEAELAEAIRQQTEDTETILAAGIAPRYHRRILLNLRAMANAIAQPLPDGSFADQVKSVFTKIGQVLSLPFVFLGTCVTELFSVTTSVLTIGSIALLAGIKLATLAILNAPLYLYEGIEYLVNKAQEPSSDDEETQNDADLGADSSAKLAGLGKGSSHDNANSANVNNYDPLFGEGNKPAAAPAQQAEPSHLAVD